MSNDIFLQCFCLDGEDDTWARFKKDEDIYIYNSGKTTESGTIKFHSKQIEEDIDFIRVLESRGWRLSGTTTYESEYPEIEPFKRHR